MKKYSNLSFKINTLNQKKLSLMKKMFPIYTFGLEFGKNNAKKLATQKKDRKKWMDTCYDILNEEFNDFIVNYKFDKPAIKNNRHVWVAWLQGFDSAPEIVKICIESIKNNVPSDVQVIQIDFNNIDEYISIPDIVYQKFKLKKIAPCFLSDIIRMKLLCEYGGLWIDSTVFVSEKIPSNYFDLDI